MQIAIENAQEALKKNEVPVGAILVEDGEIIGRGFNRIEELQDPVAHAEILAIKDAVSRKGYSRLKSATLYVTLEPCLMCTGAIINARIKRVVFGCRDKRAGTITSLINSAETFKGIHNFNWKEGILQDKCFKMIQNFFKNLRK